MVVSSRKPVGVSLLPTPGRAIGVFTLGVLVVLAKFLIPGFIGGGEDSIIPQLVETKDGSDKTPNRVGISKTIEKLSQNGVDVKLLTHDIHDHRSAYRLIRPEGQQVFNWKNVSDSIRTGSRGKEQFCTLYRDNWSCSGARYENFLSQNRPYNLSLDMGALKENSRLFMLGNSRIGQLGMTIICNTADVVVWYLKNPSENTEEKSFLNKIWYLKKATEIEENSWFGNSFVAYHPKRNVTMILLSNFGLTTPSALSILKKIGYTPDHAVVGTNNDWEQDVRGEDKPCNKLAEKALKTRQATLETFPKTNYLEFFDSRVLIGDKCCSDFRQCEQGSQWEDCHACLPGPLNSVSELMISLLINSKEQSQIRRFDNILTRGKDMDCIIPNTTNVTF